MWVTTERHNTVVLIPKKYGIFRFVSLGGEVTQHQAFLKIPPWWTMLYKRCLEKCQTKVSWFLHWREEKVHLHMEMEVLKYSSNCLQHSICGNILIVFCANFRKFICLPDVSQSTETTWTDTTYLEESYCFFLNIISSRIIHVLEKCQYNPWRRGTWLKNISKKRCTKPAFS